MDKTQIQKTADFKAQSVWNFFRQHYPQLMVMPPIIVLNGRFTQTAACNVCEGFKVFEFQVFEIVIK